MLQIGGESGLESGQSIFFHRMDAPLFGRQRLDRLQAFVRAQSRQQIQNIGQK
ncbi:hypothetical protein [Methylogaea oryzae]|uniref:hypothetical protein n=1 Tax=Methylogaea oryzae TaxID=1295382 RepID=UPI00138EF0E0|nr:hypothetical protein [Methylogaea oryzae]